MLRQATNKVIIEGILSEIDLERSTYNKNGAERKCIKGSIKIRVDLPKEEEILEIPVHVFVAEKKNNGDPNPAYKNWEDVLNWESIAVVGLEAATKVRINGGNLINNEYYSRDDRLISFPRIRANFITKITDNSKYLPQAKFETEFVVGQIQDEVDKDGVETGRLKITGIVPQYGETVDVFTFYAKSPKAVASIKEYWNTNDSVKCGGLVNFTSKAELVVDDSGFGEPDEKMVTKSVSELIINRGSEEPLVDDFAFNMEEIQKALAKRKAKLEADRDKKKNSTTAKEVIDLGF